MTTAFDTLEYVKRLRESGIPEKQAEAHAAALAIATEENLATKSDIKDVKSDIKDVKSDIKEVRTEFKSEIRVLVSRIVAIQWVLGFIAAGMIALLIKSFVP